MDVPESRDLITDAEYGLGQLARGGITCAAGVERAFAKLTALLSPITVQALRDTDGLVRRRAARPGP